jgi:hypothetical protein
MPDSNLSWIPNFEFGADSLQLSYPMTPFTFGARTEGYLKYTAEAVPTANVRMRKYLLFTSLRFTETEWLAVKQWLAFAQYGDPFSWLPDAETDITCHLESPRMAEVITPARDPTLIWLMILPIVLSKASPWDIQYVAGSAGVPHDGAFDFDAFDPDAFFFGG